MERFVKAIRQSVEDKNWLAATFIALTMPDICSAVQNPYERKVGIRYKAWFERYLKNSFRAGDVIFTAEDCYQFRCRCLHEGILRRAEDEKFHLTPPNPLLFMHLCYLNGKIQLQVDIFCEQMCLAVERWIEDMRPYPAVASRMNELIEISFPPGMVRYE
ncbi:hypothetical protein [Enterobacter cloacae]|uniref:hypothetical protein n=1 Tax=Enterobacter cloacae TaxID=550 RepID=UPI002FD8655E